LELNGRVDFEWEGERTGRGRRRGNRPACFSSAPFLVSL
jgi:hypothetical protein